MEAEDILTATHELEETGMTRPQSEAIAKTIIAAVEPLATKADLEATKADLKSIREQMATKSDLKQMATKSDLNSLKEHVATKKDIESAKVWFMVIFLGVNGSLLAIAVGIALTLFRFGVGG